MEVKPILDYTSTVYYKQGIYVPNITHQLFIDARQATEELSFHVGIKKQGQPTPKCASW